VAVLGGSLDADVIARTLGLGQWVVLKHDAHGPSSGCLLVACVNDAQRL